MAEIRRGSLGPFIQSETYTFDPQRGQGYHAEYRGMDYSRMLSTYSDYVASGFPCRITRSQGTVSLDIEDNSQPFTTDTWQIVGNDMSYDIFSHPAVASLTSDQMAAIREALNADMKETEAFAAAPLTTVSAVVKRFYSLYQRGTTDYRRAQYVLRHTTNAPNRWAANISDVGVEKIYTTSQLLSEAQNSGLWVYPLPGRLAYKISNIPVPTSRTNYQWGWLKAPSTETTAADNRVDITTEYCLEMWSTDLYSVY